MPPWLSTNEAQVTVWSGCDCSWIRSTYCCEPELVWLSLGGITPSQFSSASVLGCLMVGDSATSLCARSTEKTILRCKIVFITQPNVVAKQCPSYLPCGKNFDQHLLFLSWSRILCDIGCYLFLFMVYNWFHAAL